MKKIYRQGALGALMDEYERATLELQRLVEQISNEDFLRVVDPHTSDENCRSVQTIIAHVVSAGYGYADYIRQAFALPSTRLSQGLLAHEEALTQLEAMLAYTAQTLACRWQMTQEEVDNTTLPTTGWEVTYNLEQLLEHAIVHVLRHRRQIEKFIQQRDNPE